MPAWLRYGRSLPCGCCRQVCEAFGLPFAGAALREAGSCWPVLSSMGKCDGEMCQVQQTLVAGTKLRESLAKCTT